MNPAEIATALAIEETLGSNPAYRKVEDRLYVVKQGSAIVMINIVPWSQDKAMVRCVAQVVKGIELNGKLARQLLELNARMRFGAFAYEPVDQVVLFMHSILGGHTLDADELTTTLRDVALIADEYDDKLVELYGGQRMRDLMEEAAVERLIDLDPDSFEFETP
ncbi:T3SS (YopN, CesT) and YbjN peptide-binding chaperone 1 [Haliangium ochraceum]|nr:YbjN domain-containing protein [Haliangium ochraceum]